MEFTQHNTIANFIWNVADDVLRDVYVRGKYRDVILPMTVIRRLDAVLEPTKPAVLAMKERLDRARIANQDATLKQAAGYAFYNASPFTLRDLKARAKQQQLKADFNAYLDGFSPNVHPQKHDVFILDFVNDADTIETAFADYYRTTLLSEETDPDKLHDLKNDLDNYQVYAGDDVNRLVALYLGGGKRDQLDLILDVCVTAYTADLDEVAQVEFKGMAKTFVRTYSFLSTVLSYSLAEWEKLATFLNFLIPKLPAPKEDDLSKGILETVDMDSYRVEVKQALAIALADADGSLEPVPLGGFGGKPEAELDRLSNILRAFNDQFGNIPWKDADKVAEVINEDIPAKVAADKAYQNAQKNSDQQNARIENDNALLRVMHDLLADQTELYKQFSDNESFRKWLADMVFAATYKEGGDREAAQ